MATPRGNSGPHGGAKAKRKAVIVEGSALPKWIPAVIRDHQEDSIALFVLTLLALATRFWKIAEPAAVVFDEHHL